jgi:hypothetical protein
MGVQPDAAQFSIKTDDPVAVSDRDTTTTLQVNVVQNYPAKILFRRTVDRQGRRIKLGLPVDAER